MPTRACLQNFFKRSAFVVVVAWAVTLSSSAMGLPEALVSMRCDVATLQENFAVLKSALGETGCGVSRYIIKAALHELLRRTETNLD
jgi:hypothetical protein